ncbi:hypothetical protein [Acinetobacter baumannii]|uniref:hypothetical protein n=1 Tax=Acinetobacter baumannii TaxID=470 RepID=UPI00244705DC|nr:hypothetical protein [Acinetobacter baumannii]MDH2596892.1 hypothetical protein [Acinetobacter baumannii]
MLFNKDEIENLKFCGEIAEYLNDYNEKATSSIKSSKDFFNIEDNKPLESFKNIILSLDGVVNRICKDSEIDTIKDIFNNFCKNFKETKANYKFENFVDSFVLDLFNFIKDLFDNKILFDSQAYSLSIDYINLIKEQLIAFNNLRNSNINMNRTPTLHERVVLLEDEIKRLYKELNISSAQIKETVDGFVLAQQEYFNDQLNSLIDNLRSSLGSIHNKYESEVKGKVENLETLIDQTDQDFKSTFNDYNQLKGLVNIKGEMLITDHYKKRAFWERITYWAMTLATFIIIILSICLALNGLNEYKEKTDMPVTNLIENYKDQPIEKIEKIYSAAQENALIYLVLRLIFSVLLFSSIIYTSRVAYRAYVHMRHSENMMLKLATLRPFINQLKEDERNQIHKDLVPDYFGKDAGLVDTANEKFKDLPANVSAVAMKAIEQISGSGSSSSKEKNNKKPESETG